jgi:hypothetical protein
MGKLDLDAAGEVQQLDQGVDMGIAVLDDQQLQAVPGGQNLLRVRSVNISFKHLLHQALPSDMRFCIGFVILPLAISLRLLQQLCNIYFPAATCDAGKSGQKINVIQQHGSGTIAL